MVIIKSNIYLDYLFTVCLHLYNVSSIKITGLAFLSVCMPQYLTVTNT